MKFPTTIQVSAGKITYNLTIYRKINIITGNSGIGKSTFYKLLLLYNHYKPKSVKVSSDKYEIVSVIRYDHWEHDLRECEDKIIILDEGVNYIFTSEFANIVNSLDCIVILITRVALPMLSYSPESIFTFAGNPVGHDHTLIRFSDKCNNEEITCIKTEDSNFGNKFYKHYVGINSDKSDKCTSIRGIGNIVESVKNNTNCLYIVDGSGFGPYYLDVMKYMLKSNIVYYPESFEYLLLLSGIFKKYNLQYELTHLWEFADSKEFLSWERYCTHRIEELTKDTQMHYSKTGFNNKYVSDENIKYVFECMPDNIVNILKNIRSHGGYIPVKYSKLQDRDFSSMLESIKEMGDV